MQTSNLPIHPQLAQSVHAAESLAASASTNLLRQRLVRRLRGLQLSIEEVKQDLNRAASLQSSEVGMAVSQSARYTAKVQRVDELHRAGDNIRHSSAQSIVS